MYNLSTRDNRKYVFSRITRNTDIPTLHDYKIITARKNVLFSTISSLHFILSYYRVDTSFCLLFFVF